MLFLIRDLHGLKGMEKPVWARRVLLPAKSQTPMPLSVSKTQTEDMLSHPEVTAGGGVRLRGGGFPQRANAGQPGIAAA